MFRIMDDPPDPDEPRRAAERLARDPTGVRQQQLQQAIMAEMSLPERVTVNVPNIVLHCPFWQQFQDERSHRSIELSSLQAPFDSVRPRQTNDVASASRSDRQRHHGGEIGGRRHGSEFKANADSLRLVHKREPTHSSRSHSIDHLAHGLRISAVPEAPPARRAVQYSCAGSITQSCVL